MVCLDRNDTSEGSKDRLSGRCQKYSTEKKIRIVLDGLKDGETARLRFQAGVKHASAS